jgi:hypothetical protein
MSHRARRKKWYQRRRYRAFIFGALVALLATVLGAGRAHATPAPPHKRTCDAPVKWDPNLGGGDTTTYIPTYTVDGLKMKTELQLTYPGDGTNARDRKCPARRRHRFPSRHGVCGPEWDREYLPGGKGDDLFAPWQLDRRPRHQLLVGTVADPRRQDPSPGASHRDESQDHGQLDVREDQAPARSHRLTALSKTATLHHHRCWVAAVNLITYFY